MIVGGVVFCEYILVVEIGLKDVMENGVLVGYLLVDIKVKFYDGLYYDVDLNEIVFCVVVFMVLCVVVKKVNLVIFELIMVVEVVIFEDYLGDVMGYVIVCCGCVEGMEVCVGG